MSITRIQLDRGNYFEDAYQAKVRHASAYFSCKKYGEAQAELLAKEAEQAFQKELPKQPKENSLRGTCGPFYLTLSGRVLFLRISYLNVKGTFSTAGRSLGGRTLKQAFEELWKILKLETGVVPKGKKVIAYNLMQSVHKRIELERSRGVPVPDVKLGYGDNYSCVLTVDGHPSLVKKPQVRKGK